MTAKAKSQALLMLLPLGSPARKWLLACFGDKRHYATDGSCVHVVAVARACRWSEWRRARTKWLPFGDRDGPATPVKTLTAELDTT